MSENKKSTKSLSELGEFGLISHLTKDFKVVNESTKIGVGDDAAVVNYGGKDTVITTDILVEGVHFNLMYAPLKHLGYKAVVVNLSDVYAMNATPKQITVSIAVSNRFNTEALDDLYAGIKLACERYGVDLVGGDTTSSVTGLIISITALGEAKSEDITYRNTAEDNDLICVSGDLGAAYMGLQLLERENEVFKVNPNMQPELSGFDYIVERQLKPEARQDVIEVLKKNNIKPTAMIDISDGLSSEVLHICSNSGKGCKIYEEKIPLDTQTQVMAAEFNVDPITCALNGGEDYELLFTIKQSDFEKAKEIIEFSIIGHITDASEGANLIAKDGTQVPLSAQGWNALKEE